MSFTELSTSDIQANPTFKPVVPRTLEQLNLPILFLEDLILKILLSQGSLTGREISEALCLTFGLVEPILADMKARMLVGHRASAPLGDFTYILSEQGRSNGMQAKEYSAYVGAAPVPFQDYLDSVSQQSIRRENPTEPMLQKAFSDLIVDPQLFATIGPAINSGRGMFLFGEPGNGKTALAERITLCFRDHIYIPQTLWIDGQIIRLFDPQNHEELPLEPEERIDARWKKIKRPTVVVGGELTMEALELKWNPLLKICEAPLQLKANCGTFLIDDFGRQRISHAELLNRWIIPLEKQYDFLLLPNGKKIQVPFDELIIFSTNLDPKSLVDDAFLRRIPYKIHVDNPTEAQFRAIFEFLAPRLNIPYEPAVLDYLIETHYKGKRVFKACQPRDLLYQLLSSCAYYGIEPKMTPELFDEACRNYFAAMGNLPE